LDGIFNINKPAGKTSFGVVAAIKRLISERHAGHAGTLDPDATGVLPVCLGQGTRIVEFLMETKKTYRAKVELGKATDTYDGSGKITCQGDTSGIDIGKVEQSLALFRGNIEQIPPMYSAVKHQGQPLYRLARAGISIQRKSRKVTIHRLELISQQLPLITLEIECSKGTYIRSLVHDLGEGLGCGAYLKNLVRTRYGIFDIKDAISLMQLEEAIRQRDWQQYLYPIDSVLEDFDKIVVNEAGEQAMKGGRLLNPGHIISQDIKEDSHYRYCRAYSQDGCFLGMLQPVLDREIWQPKKVFI